MCGLFWPVLLAYCCRGRVVCAWAVSTVLFLASGFLLFNLRLGRVGMFVPCYFLAQKSTKTVAQGIFHTQQCHCLTFHLLPVATS